MPDTIIKLTPKDVLAWLCDRLPADEQRRLVRALAVHAELLLAPRGYRGRTAVRTVNISNGLGQILQFSSRLSIEGPEALDAAKIVFDQGPLTVRSAFWTEVAGRDLRIRIGAVCLSGGATIATVAVGEKAVEFTIVPAQNDSVESPDLVA